MNEPRQLVVPGHRVIGGVCCTQIVYGKSTSRDDVLSLWTHGTTGNNISILGAYGRV